MKYCPTCNTRYDEEILRFCMKDGTPLVKALDWLLEHVEIVDENGTVIDRAALEIEEEAVAPASASEEDAAPAAEAPDAEDTAQAETEGDSE